MHGKRGNNQKSCSSHLQGNTGLRPGGTLALESPPSSKDIKASLREEPFVEESCRTGRGDPEGQVKERALRFHNSECQCCELQQGESPGHMPAYMFVCTHVHVYMQWVCA